MSALSEYASSIDAMSRTGSVAYGAAVVALIILLGQDTNNSYLFFYDHSTPPMFALGMAGWGVATFGPLILSVFIWWQVKRLRAKWTLHLLFIPGGLALNVGGLALLDYAAGSPIDSMPHGIFSILAISFLLLTVLFHTGALIVELVRMSRRPANTG